MSLNTWLQFFLACWIISISPGAGAIACMSCGLRYGYRLGLFNIAGLISGILFLVFIVALGLGALLAASETAFLTIKWLGVVYLIGLGIAQWRVPITAVEAQETKQSSPKGLFISGFLVNASNPKGIVFMLAVLPQFIDIAKPLATQYAICGATLAFTDFVIMSGYTVLAARVLRLLRTPHQVKLLNRTFASLFIGAGLLLANFHKKA